MNPIRSYEVTVKSTTLDDKGAVTSQVVVEGFPRIINATSAENAESTARYLMLRNDPRIASAEASATNDDGVISVNSALVEALSAFFGTTDVCAVQL